jgi:2'-5' RNA ligase
MPPATLRLFVAIYPAPEVTLALLRALSALPLGAARILPADQVHLTLQFIGDTPASDLEEVSESLRRSAAGVAPFTLTATRLLTLPERGPARLVAAEADRPAGLLEVHRRLVSRLARRVKPERRDYLPHITLARFRHPVPGARLEQPLPPAGGPWSFPVTRLALMKSDLRPEGAVHREIAAAELG